MGFGGILGMRRGEPSEEASMHQTTPRNGSIRSISMGSLTTKVYPRYGNAAEASLPDVDATRHVAGDQATSAS